MSTPISGPSQFDPLKINSKNTQKTTLQDKTTKLQEGKMPNQESLINKSQLKDIKAKVINTKPSGSMDSSAGASAELSTPVNTPRTTPTAPATDTSKPVNKSESNLPFTETPAFTFEQVKNAQNIAKPLIRQSIPTHLTSKPLGNNQSILNKNKYREEFDLGSVDIEAKGADYVIQLVYSDSLAKEIFLDKKFVENTFGGAEALGKHIKNNLNHFTISRETNGEKKTGLLESEQIKTMLKDSFNIKEGPEPFGLNPNFNGKPNEEVLARTTFKTTDDTNDRNTNWVKDDVSKMKLNRYTNILPNQETAIVINEKYLRANHYINANMVRDNFNSYIATQGPLENTIGDFFQMIWEKNSSTVFTLAKEFEGGKLKCFNYWSQCQVNGVDQIGKTWDVPASAFSLKLKSFHDDTQNNTKTRIFEMTDKISGKVRDIKHIAYEGWPDFGVPAKVEEFEALMDHLKDVNTHINPPVVHCSAGVGRTGVFLLAHSSIANLDNMKEGAFSINTQHRGLRMQRGGLVQNEEQYVFATKAIYDHVAKAKNSTQINTPNPIAPPSQRYYPPPSTPPPASALRSATIMPQPSTTTSTPKSKLVYPTTIKTKDQLKAINLKREYNTNNPKFISSGALDEYMKDAKVGQFIIRYSDRTGNFTKVTKLKDMKLNEEKLPLEQARKDCFMMLDLFCSKNGIQSGPHLNRLLETPLENLSELNMYLSTILNSLLKDIKTKDQHHNLQDTFIQMSKQLLADPNATANDKASINKYFTQFNMIFKENYNLKERDYI